VEPRVPVFTEPH
jgi:ribonuclease HI